MLSFVFFFGSMDACLLHKRREIAHRRSVVHEVVCVVGTVEVFHYGSLRMVLQPDAERLVLSFHHLYDVGALRFGVSRNRQRRVGSASHALVVPRRHVADGVALGYIVYERRFFGYCHVVRRVVCVKLCKFTIFSAITCSISQFFCMNFAVACAMKH